jgi:ATP-dependent Clp protease ATP-binding subunit ClpC
MEQRFTDHARWVMLFAELAARRLCHTYVGQEHVLLGIIEEKGGTAARSLSRLGADPQKVRDHVEKVVVAGPDEPHAFILVQTPAVRRAIAWAAEEATRLSHAELGTGHLLLGLIRDRGFAAQVLIGLGLNLDKVRDEILHQLDEYGGGDPKSK